MVLLTSSTISLALSTSIICTFTFLLFLSGYVLQQQTVRGLQEALRAPPPPKPMLPPNFRNTSIEDGILDDLEDDQTESTLEGYDDEDELDGLVPGKVRKKFGHPPGTSGHRSYEQSVLSSEPSNGHTREHKGIKQAYIQILSNPDPSEICSAILLFKTLEEAGEIVQSDRLLLYPRSWDLDPPSPDMEAAIAMLHAPVGGVEINRISIDVSGGLVSRLIEDELLESSLSLLRQYHSILYLRSPGMIVDAKRLEYIFQSKRLESSSSASDWASPSQWVASSNLEKSPDESSDASPPVLFVSSAGPATQRSSLEFNIPSSTSSDFASVPGSPGTEGHGSISESLEPAFVHFQTQGEELPDSNSYYHTWREQSQEVCPGIDLISSLRIR